MCLLLLSLLLLFRYEEKSGKNVLTAHLSAGSFGEQNLKIQEIGFSVVMFVTL